MAKNSVADWSATAADNTDIGGTNIGEGCSPSGINNAIRELMAQVATDRSNLLHKSGDGERVLMGVIRQSTDTGGWAFIDDTNHTPIGFNTATISQSSTAITLPFDFTGTEIRSLVAVPDEHYAQRGLVCGCSVGVSSATLQMAMPLVGGFRWNPDASEPGGVGSGAGAGYFLDAAVAADLSVSESSGVLTVTHGTMVDGNIAPVIGNLRGGWSGSAISSNVPSAGVVEGGGFPSTTSFSLQSSVPISAFIQYNTGTSLYDISTDCAGTFTATFDSGTDTLTVTHPRSASAYDLVVGNHGYTTLVTAQDEDSFSVQFVNSAGTVLEPTNTNGRLSFVRAAGFARLSSFPRRFVSFARGHVMVNPNKVYSASGNIWLFGVVKK